MVCEYYKIEKAVISKPKNKKKVCRECFYERFENDLHNLIVESGMFERNSRVGFGINGGKDSAALARALNKLISKYNCGLDLVLLCMDEGISGYRDKSIQTVLGNQNILDMSLGIVSYKDLFGMTMVDVVKKIG